MIINYSKITEKGGSKMVVDYLKLQKVLCLFVLLLTNGVVWAQNHDLVMESDLSAWTSNVADCKSPDISVAAPCGDLGASDEITLGRSNELYARFHINGFLDPTVTPPPHVQVEFYYRPGPAAPGPTPPPLTSPGWTLIGTLTVSDPHPSGLYLPFDYKWPDGTAGSPYYTNPADIPSVQWNAPISGDYFYIAAKVIHAVTDNDLNNNVAYSLYKTVEPQRIEVVLLMDLSGSMSTYTYSGYSYFEHSIDKAKAFVAHMNANDYLSIVGYGGCLAGSVDNIWPPTGLLQLVDKNAANIVLDVISAPAGHCMTPMGKGIERAVSILTGPSSNAGSKKVILLFTDGYENDGSPRACSNSNTPPCNMPSPSVLDSLQVNDIQVYSVALGTFGWEDCIDCLATGANGRFYDATTLGVDLEDIILDMQQDYENDDLYKKDKTTIGAGSDAYDVYFEGVDDTLYFVVGWDNLGIGMELNITSPSGRSPKYIVYQGKGHLVYQVLNPEKGLWHYSVYGPHGERYIAAVRSDKVVARMSLALEAPRTVGGTINILAGITGVSPDRVRMTATATFPFEASFNTVLSDCVRDYILEYKQPPVTAGDREKNPDNSDKGIFLDKMQRLGISIQDLLWTAHDVNLPLTMQRDGAFTAEVNKHTQIEGRYKITVKALGDKVDRVYSRSVYLAPDSVEPRESYAELLGLGTLNRVRQYLVRIYCRDQYGNLAAVQDTLKDLEVVYEGALPADRLNLAFDGVVTLTLHTDLNTPPDVFVFYQGEKIPVQPLF